MTKIVSRIDRNELLTELRVTQLQEVLLTHSRGAITRDASGVEPVATTLDELIAQAARVLNGYNMTVMAMATNMASLETQNAILQNRVELLDDIVARLSGDVGYDDAIDTATLSMMDDIASQLDCATNADGDLVFHQRAVISKGDLKPILREAIVTWISERLGMENV